MFIQNTDTKTTKDEVNIELSGYDDGGKEQTADTDLSVSIILLLLNSRDFLFGHRDFNERW